MELLYVWIYKSDNGVINNRGFNFSRDYDITSDFTNSTLTITLTERTNVFRYPSENIVNISAIVGENGSGKSTVMRQLRNDNKHVLLLFKDGEKYYISHDTSRSDINKNVKVIVNKKGVTFKSLENNKVSFLYYSGALLNEVESVSLKNNTIDIIDNSNFALYKRLINDNTFNTQSQQNVSLGYLESLIDINNIIFYNENSAFIEDNTEIKFDRIKIDFNSHNFFDDYTKKNNGYNNYKEVIDKVSEWIPKDIITTIKKYYYNTKTKLTLTANNNELNNKDKTKIKNLFYTNLLVNFLFDLTKKHQNCIVDFENNDTSKLNLKDVNIGNFEQKIDGILGLFNLRREKPLNYNADTYINIAKVIKDINLDIKQQCIYTDFSSLKKLIDVLYESKLLNIFKYTSINEEFNGIIFSTGEQQFFSLLSRIDMCFNSAYYNSNPPKSYISNYVILLDEPETHFHPEWIRKFISILIDYIKTINDKKIHNDKKIQVIIATNNPILIGDIPSQHISILSKDKDGTFGTKETFSQNIHTILKDSFFMKNTFGEFSSDYINKLNEFLTNEIKEAKANINKEKSINEKFNDLFKDYISEKEDFEDNNKKYHFLKNMISFIGEPILKKHFESLLERWALDNNLNEQLINFYQQKNKELEGEQNDKTK